MNSDDPASRLPMSTSFLPTLDPMVTVTNPSASVLQHNLLQQECSVCKRNLSALFSRNICHTCREPVCADHIREIPRGGRELWVCEQCFKEELMETQDVELERIVKVLKLRLYGFEQERDRLNKEIAATEAKTNDLNQEISLHTVPYSPENVPVSSTAPLTAELSELLSKAKSDYASLLRETTEMENSLTSLLREEESLKADIATEEQRNQTLACSIIEHTRVLDKRVQAGRLKNELCLECYRDVKKQFRDEMKAGAMTESHSGKSDSETRRGRCLFC